jgi:hypothetical protein
VTVVNSVKMYLSGSDEPSTGAAEHPGVSAMVR